MNPQSQSIIPAILNDFYSDLKDLGAIESYIPTSCHTADFELSEGFKVRVCESKKGVYYNIFRVN